MNKIKIKYFGPIQLGYQEDDGFILIDKVTVFIGNQGSGKSTVAKLISTMLWIEKGLVKGLLNPSEIQQTNRFVKVLEYQKIASYLQEKTEIIYHGQAFVFTFIANHITITKTDTNGYLLPKIMYAPAERNFLSVVDRPDKLKNLPSALYTFNDEYDNAKVLYAKGVSLPINNARFEYDKLNQLAHISVSNGYKLRLSEASSGFQSTVPLFLVTKYLSDSLNAEESQAVRKHSLEEQKKIEKEMKNILEDTQITPEIRQAYLRQLSSLRKPTCFINIVEEPEQNLFPSSQQHILNALLKYVNAAEGNQLIITTHSPYIINYLNLAIYGAYLKQKIADNSKHLIAKLDAIVPTDSMVSANEVRVYELDETNGIIKKLSNYEGVLSDNNYLNNYLRQGNTLFDSLLAIEEEL